GVLAGGAVHHAEGGRRRAGSERGEEPGDPARRGDHPRERGRPRHDLYGPAPYITGRDRGGWEQAARRQEGYADGAGTEREFASSLEVTGAERPLAEGRGNRRDGGMGAAARSTGRSRAGVRPC